LGNIYKDKEDFESAISAFEKAVFYDSHYTLALANLGYCYLKVGKYKEAFISF
jgi:tetratricopeptide (TPR) repeat protein